MSLLKECKAFKPFKYPWAYETWLTHENMHWLHTEVPMADDIADWKGKLTDGEKDLCTQIFRFFTQADIEVNDCYMRKYLSVFKPIEVQMMLSGFSNRENVHIAAYSHLIDSLGMPDSIYQEFLNYKEMKDKYDYMQKFNCNTKEGIATTLAVFGGFTEGVQLFGTFAILLNFQRFNKLKGMGQIVAWSVRDEDLHCASITRLFNEFIHENPEVWNEKLKHDIYEACSTIIHFEDAFIDLAFSIVKELDDLTPKDIKKYIRYIADRRLEGLGLKPIYQVDANPLPWIDLLLGAKEHANFFEAKPTSYSKGAITGDWTDSQW